VFFNAVQIVTQFWTKFSLHDQSATSISEVKEDDQMKRKTMLPPEKRVIDVGWNDDDELLLCFKYFEGGGKYDGFFPFSYFSASLKNFDDLKREIVTHFGTEFPLPDQSQTSTDELKRVLVNEFEGSGQ
jgi:hypothetical protein